MARGGAVLAMVAAGLLLAGCATAPALPAGPTEAEVQAMVDEQNRQWWQSIAPDEPMPVIEPIEYQGPDDGWTALNECMNAIPPGDQHTWEKATFVCSMQYPSTISDPEAMGFYSSAQLGFLYDYYTERLAPCLELMGYTIVTTPSRELFLETTYLSWVPYYSMTPQPQAEQEWKRIDARCPPPPIGEYWRPGVDFAVG